LTGALVPPTASEAPLITYLDSDNNALTMPTALLTAAQRSLVAAVKVSIKLKSDDATAGKPVAFESIIGIPNLGINRPGQEPCSDSSRHAAAGAGPATRAASPSSWSSRSARSS